MKQYNCVQLKESLMKNFELVEMISKYLGDYTILIDGSSEFVIEESGDVDNRTLNFLKR